MYFHTALSIFPFLSYRLYSKSDAVNQTIPLVFVKGRPLVAKKYKLQRLKMNLNFKILTFSFEVYFEGGSPKM